MEHQYGGQLRLLWVAMHFGHVGENDLYSANQFKTIFKTYLDIDTSFVDIGALRVKILIFKGQISFHPQTRALTFWPKQIFEAR